MERSITVTTSRGASAPGPGSPRSQQAVPGSGHGAAPSRFRATPRDLLAITKPRITTIVLATGGAGVALAPGSIPTSKLLLSLTGTVLVVSAANALNMWWERDVDGRMERTRRRPLPAGRMGDLAALTFGLLLGAISVPMLFAVNPLTGALGLLALVSYVAVYTPLKRKTSLALQIGAVPGAIPPLLGWTSVTGRLDAGGLFLFAVLFLWQLPHFVAISMFRADDYARAGLKVHAVAHGLAASRVSIVWSTALLVATSLVPLFFPTVLGPAGAVYAVVSVALGAAFVVLAARGLGAPAESALRWARQVFGYTLVYLVVLLVAMLVDHRIGAA